jgi:hypothetical protein
MIVEMKAPSVIPSPCCFFTLSFLYSCEKKNMLKLKWGNILFDPHNLPTIWFVIPQDVRRIEHVYVKPREER